MTTAYIRYPSSAGSTPVITGYLKADGSIPLTANWPAGAFTATFNSVAVGSAANRISGLATIINGAGTLTLPTSTDTIVGRATTDILSNKTLTAPVIATIVNTGTLTLPTSTDTLVGKATTDVFTNKSISGSTNTLTNIADGSLTTSYLKADGSRALTGNWAAGAFSATHNSVVVGSAANTISGLATIINGAGTLTLPTSTDTLVGKATTDILTNKTLTAPVIATIVNTGTLTLPTSTDTLVGKATTDVFTNKSISGSTNTLSAIADGSLSTSYVKADGTRALSANWAAGAFSATHNSVIVGSAAGAIDTSAATSLLLKSAGTTAITVDTSQNVFLNSATGQLLVNQSAAIASYFHAMKGAYTGKIGLLVWNTDNSANAGGFQVITNTGASNLTQELIGAYTANGSTAAFRVLNNNEVRLPNITTTASAANAFLDNANQNNVLRSTSSLRYKKNVTDLALDTSKVFDLRPVEFDDKNRSTHHFGLIAEEVAEVMPALVQYTAETALDPNGDPDKQVPDGVQYQLLSVLLLAEVKKLKARLEVLESK